MGYHWDTAWLGSGLYLFLFAQYPALTAIGKIMTIEHSVLE
jgi:hypothetical protein